MASADLGAGGVGVRPRSIGNRQWLLFYRNFDQRSCAMELLQFTVWQVFFSGGDDRQQEGPSLVAREGLGGFIVFSLLFRVLCEVWLEQVPLYPLRTVLYSYLYLLVFLI